MRRRAAEVQLQRALAFPAADPPADDDPPDDDDPPAGDEPSDTGDEPADGDDPADPSLTWATPAAIDVGTKLSGEQLRARSSAPGTFAYDPASGSTPAAGEHTLSATFEPDDREAFRGGTVTTTLVVRAAEPATEPETPAAVDAAAAAVPAGDLLAIEIDGEPGIKVVDGFVRVTGKGLKPGSEATVYVRSTPQLIGSARADAGGVLSTRVRLPAGLATGGHHIEVRGTSAAGVAIVKLLPFTVAAGDRLGSVGEIPDGPFARLVPYRAAAHLEAVLGIGIASFALLGALGAALGNRGGSHSGGSRSGGSRSGGAARGGGGSDGAFLEDVEVGRETEDGSGGGRGDRSGTWRWRSTRHVDRFAVGGPGKLASLSPVIGRVSVDGDYLRAMFGGMWLLLFPLAIGLGIAAAVDTGGEALPPAFALFVAILALSIFDALVGYVAGVTFVVAVIAAGGLTSSASVRLLLGIVLVWFVVPLLAAAVRPFRRALNLRLAGVWDRAADLVIGGLFAGWAAANVTEALSPLAGYELPIAEHKWTIAIIVIGLVALRMAAETIAAQLYPKRLRALAIDGDLESGNRQVAVALVCQILLYLFISAAFLELEWPLFAGVALFFVPLVPWLFADRLPKSAIVAKWMPVGLAKWSFVIVAGILMGRLLDALVEDPAQALNWGFIVLPLPILFVWGLELFALEDEDEDEDGDEAPEEEAGRFPMTWPLRLLGVPALGMCLYLILGGIA